MSRLTDRLEELERALDRNEGDTEDAFQARRMVFRKVLTAWGDERWHEGYGDGQRDVWAAAAAAERAERERETTAPEATREED